MAIKLVLVISLIVFMCCVMAAPAAEYQRSADPSSSEAVTTSIYSGPLVGGELEAMCGYTNRFTRAAGFEMSELLASSDAMVGRPTRSGLIANWTVVSSDSLKASIR